MGGLDKSGWWRRAFAPVVALLMVATGLVLTVGLTPASATTPVTAASFVSEQGDYIGGGSSYDLPTVTLTGQQPSVLTFSASDSTGDQFTVVIAAPAGQNLEPGSYTDVQRAEFRGAGFPGLDVYGDGRGCNTVAGSFTVYDATYDMSGNLVSFAAQFFQHCEGFYAALMGNISYNSTATIPAIPASAPEPPSSARLVSMPGDYLGLGEAYSYPIAYPFGGPNRWELADDSSAVAWDIDISAANNAPLAVGTYNDAQRFEGADNPGLDVSGLGRGCNTDTGSFTIYALTTDAMGVLNSFAMEFSEVCDNSNAPLYGEIRWNSSVAMPALPTPEPALMATPSSLDFGNVRVGDYTQAEAVTITNEGGAVDHISGGTIVGPAADDFFAESNCGELAPLAQCLIEVVFFPGATGERNATIVLDDSAPTRTTISLRGFGTEGYYEVSTSGQVYTFGDASSYGDMSQTPLSAPVVSMTTVPGGFGYWLLGADGGIFSFGDAQFYGSTGGRVLNAPVIAMCATPDGRGYWLVASDGGIFSYGDAQFYGSTGSLHLNKPIVGMAATPDGRGYWLVASDGGIFNYGDAQFYGSTGAINLAKPIVGMAPSPSGAGYWFVASDGGIFNYGDAQFDGSNGGVATQPIVAIAGTAPPTIEAQFDVPALRAHAAAGMHLRHIHWSA
jgi:hypothetical protein